ncbi:hypothetical protein GM418_04485 [Maribellus comscasis]|uniref:Uncharacterized protein n=1 Tax=Maribellus comscasis TaxID=2681766 RepID=A0A6I6JPK0_9BACT|nr:hypothetical protein [Maribellus comscasis]QGY42940.1 hypothetical protein GM418_04485 [Maribellus comscasis]
MKLLMSIDLYLWNHFVPKISEDFFKRKFNSVLAMSYISLFKLPRKFLMNYFRGQGRSMVVDTQKLVVENETVLNKLKSSVQQSFREGQKSGFFCISQADIYNPAYKYSIGSFRINYKFTGTVVEVNMHSDYRFQESPDRITRHIHHWLFTLKSRNKTNDFEIFGKSWMTSVNELFSFKTEKQQKNEPKLRLLV